MHFPCNIFRSRVLNRLRVILADDEPNFLEVATRLLERDFEIVKTVGDGQR
jgi:CheY-like chemotaxis protein